MDERLSRLGRLVSEVEVADLDAAERLDLGIQRVRYRLADSMDEGRTSRRRSRVALVAAAAALIVAAGWFSWFRAEEPLRVYAESHAGELTGATVRSVTGTKQLRFTDGTRLALYPSTVVQVVETTDRGATLRLENGRTFASIVPERDGKWRFIAGPYVIRVTGTEFDLSWDAQAQQVELALHRGSVILTGPNVPGELLVQGSEFVRFRAQEPEAEKAESSQAVQEQDVESRTEKTETTEVKASAPIPPPRESKADADGPRSAQQLWDMVQQHRKRGEGQAARDVLLELRSRHGARGQTAYLLGRVHADLLGSTPEAVHWFEMYLKEAPGGSLSEQALGRLIELQSGTAAGKAAAERYLRAYPDGSYARLARSSLR